MARLAFQLADLTILTHIFSYSCDCCGRPLFGVLPFVFDQDREGFQSFSPNRTCCVFLFVTASILMCLSRLLMLICIPFSSTNSCNAVNNMEERGSFIFMKLTMCCATCCSITVSKCLKLFRNFKGSKCSALSVRG